MKGENSMSTTKEQAQIASNEIQPGDSFTVGDSTFTLNDDGTLTETYTEGGQTYTETYVQVDEPTEHSFSADDFGFGDTNFAGTHWEVVQ